MDSQTTINECWWCGDPGSTEVLVTPSVRRTVDGAPVVTNPVHAWACPVHAAFCADSDPQDKLKWKVTADQMELL